MNNDVAAVRFPIRPGLREGESMGGWCWRTYAENGYDLPAKARSVLLAIRTTRMLEPDDALSQLFGFQRLKQLYDRENSILHHGVGQPSPKSYEPIQLPLSWYHWSHRPRFCAQCLAEVECHLVYWDLPLVSACAVHGSKLLTRCHACPRVLGWVSLQTGWRCRCGARISAGQSKQALPQAVRLSRTLCAASDALVPQSVKEASRDSAPIRAAYRTRDVYARALAANNGALGFDRQGLRLRPQN